VVGDLAWLETVFETILGLAGTHPVECAPARLGPDEPNPDEKKCCNPKHMLSVHGVVFAILFPRLAAGSAQAAAFGKL
jgi:hypothetical protein